MRRRDPPDEDPDAPEDDEEEDEPRRTPRRRTSRLRRAPAKPWADADDDEEEGSKDHVGSESARHQRWHLPHRDKEPVYYRARDSVFFEPLVALAIIVLILVALFAYTQNWPPLYVVESMSMQHGTVDHVGLINTGDLVLAQKVPLSAITPYVVGMTDGYSTYGEYGDVVLYHPDGGSGGTPIIHRAIVYLVANPNGGFNAPALQGLPCGTASNWVFSANSSSTTNGCATTDMVGVLTIRNIGWQSVYLSLDLAAVGRSSGFVTMGDNNIDGNQGIPDEPGLTTLVQPGWIVGVARGMLPWFGAVKLLLAGQASEVPVQSWEYLGLSVFLLIGLALGFHYLLRAEGIEDPRRKAQEADEEPDEDEPAHPRSWRHPLQGWRDEDEAQDETSAGTHRPKKPSKHSAPSSGGRPRPRVGRKPPRGGDDSEEDL